MTLFETANLRIEATAPETATLWLDVAERPVNVFNRRVLADLEAAFGHLEKESGLKVLILRSAKSEGFVAGADLHEFTAVRDAEQARALSGLGQELFLRLEERVPQVTIAVIHGACLGGGLEMALACDYRLVVEHPKTQLGLPEIELGFVPGWGGTQRLPRVVGLENALRMILAGRRLKAVDALSWGLADAVASSANLQAVLDALVERARRQGKRPKRGLPLRTWRQRLVESNPLGRSLIFRGTARTLRQSVPDDMPAPAEALEAVRVGMRSGSAAGLVYEREAIGRLALTPACHNLVNLFFQRDKAKQLPAEARADLVAPIKRVGIVGAGTMGAGIAQLAALRGYEVVVREVSDAALTAGMKKIEDLFAKAVANRVLAKEDADQKFAAIRWTTAWDGFGYADLVVEAAFEDVELKRNVFRDLERLTRPAAVLATNTSSLLVARLQEDRDEPQRIGGLHFFNPVHKMPLVEVVRGPATDDATIATLTRWAIDVGKMPVVVKDSPGFLVNRILMPYLNEAVFLLGDCPNVGAIDRVMKRFGMPMGPLELLDQVGLDVAAHIEQAMRPQMAERFPANMLFQRMAKQGWLGIKTGIGFYTYRGKAKVDNDRVATLLDRQTSAAPADSDEFRNRMVLLMVNEAAACLAEGVVADAQTIDTAMVFGTGWAPHRGGPLHYADTLGIREVVRILADLKEKHGPRFDPCAELRRRAETGEPFCKPLAELATTP